MSDLDRDPTDLGLSALPEPPRHECVDGWTGDPDRPAPCPVCRPHLSHTEARSSGLAAWRARKGAA